jgi:hypothetical protein
MFSKPYEGVPYFGLWAEELADDYSASDALGLLPDAELRCGEEDMQKDEN